MDEKCPAADDAWMTVCLYVNMRFNNINIMKHVRTLWNMESDCEEIKRSPKKPINSHKRFSKYNCNLQRKLQSKVFTFTEEEFPVLA